MSCSVPVFACIHDVNRVISILNDAPTSGEQDVKENTGEASFLLTIFSLSQFVEFRSNESMILLEGAVYSRPLSRVTDAMFSFSL